MCGRYTNALTWRQIVELYRITQPGPEAAPNLAPRYNLAPTQIAPVVRPLPDGGRELALLRWGLVPFWAKDAKIASQCINARAETVATKPAFREAFKRRRCLVPADGFYEWKLAADGKKQPYRIVMQDGSPMTFAGLWEANVGLGIESFTIVTTTPNETLAPLHDRMPVILAPEDHDAWLDPSRDEAPLLRPYLGSMRFYPVSRYVSTARNEGPECVAPLVDEESGGQVRPSLL